MPIHECRIPKLRSLALRGAAVAQLVKHSTLAQVMSLGFMSSSPTLGSVLTARSLETASDSVSPSLSALCPCSRSLSKNKQTNKHWGPWVAQLVKFPTSPQAMISWFMNSRTLSGSVLTAQSLEPASDSVSPSLSFPPLPMLCLSLSLSFSKISKH